MRSRRRRRARPRWQERYRRIWRASYWFPAQQQNVPGARQRLGSLAMNAAADPVASPLPAIIDELWARRSELTPQDASARAAVVAAVDTIDAGHARVAWPDPVTGEIVMDERARRAILLAFRLLPMVASQVGDFRYHDRVPLTRHLDGVRAVAGSIVRWGAYVAPGAVLMPSFVNIGAYVDGGTMVDTWATVGSCAQIGKNVHLSGGVGIGTILTKSAHVIDVETGEELPRGEVPAWSVCVGGTRNRKFAGGEFGMPCVLVLKRLPAGRAHDKAALNDILRDHGVNA